MSDSVERLNRFEADDLLRFFLYYMEQDQRAKLMATYPLHYNKLHDKKIVQVTNVFHGQELN